MRPRLKAGALFAIPLGLATFASVSFAQGQPNYCQRAVQMDPLEEVLASPRPDPIAEILALHWSGGAAADSDLYAEIHADLEILRPLLEPGVEVTAHRSSLPSDLLFTVDQESILVDMSEGNFSAWNCLQERFDIATIDYWFGWGGGTLRFDGLYNIPALRSLYLEVPGLNLVSPNVTTRPDSSCVFEGTDGVPVYYIENIHHDMTSTYTLAAARVVMTDPPQVETWFPPSPEPVWMSEYDACLQKTAGAATLFRDGFESGDLSGWSDVSGLAG